MSKVIKIHKGLDIPLYGQAKANILDIEEDSFALKPPDHIGITPKLLVDVGDKVDKGTKIFFAKHDQRICFVSPVSGEITEIRRGEKRKIEEICIKSDGEDRSVEFPKESIATLSAEDIKQRLLDSGLWTYIRQRPYNIIPNPDTKPKYIIIKAFDSSPLAPDYNILTKGEKAAIQVGIDALRKVVESKIYLSLNETINSDDILSLQNVEKIVFKGKHPYGNISVQAEKIDAINKGERIWFVDICDLIAFGKLFLEGTIYTKRIIALTGQEVKNPQYYRVTRGTNVAKLLQDNVSNKHLRIISGNVLTGTRINIDGYLGYYDNMLTVIEEGDYKEGLGWMMPEIKRFSISRTFLKGFTAFCSHSPIKIDSNLHGSQRAYVFADNFDKVFPMHIYPMQLIKACLAKDIDRMEELGIYEVDSEDFALCEVVDVSKTNIQEIIRNGLELMRKEMGN